LSDPWTDWTDPPLWTLRAHAHAHATRPIRHPSNLSIRAGANQRALSPSLLHDVGQAAMNKLPSCFWCNRPFRARRDGGCAQRFCQPTCRRAFHAAARAWALGAIARGTLTLADVKNSAPATRRLLTGTISTAMIPGGPLRHAAAHVAAEETILPLDELSALLGDILDTLSTEELGQLPAPVWALLDFIAGYDATEAAL
jgi:hypothetical protein